jgi:enoyl-CoA hydratase/carnithine racemase
MALRLVKLKCCGLNAVLVTIFNKEASPMSHPYPGSLTCLEVEQQAKTLIVTLNRPEQLNALNATLMGELAQVLNWAQGNSGIFCVILTGKGKAFAAGADITEMQQKKYTQCVTTDDFLAIWDKIYQFSKPIIAAVNGFALGGGCEIALMCDLIVASQTAKFGQPEINIGVIPGAGGTQRLARLLGKHRTMELVLTGRLFTAQDALNWGMINAVFSPETLLIEAITLAEKMGEKSLPALILAKKAIQAADNLMLDTGLQYERNLFYSLFGTADQQEGMQAFMDKRPACFTGI